MAEEKEREYIQKPVNQMEFWTLLEWSLGVIKKHKEAVTPEQAANEIISNGYYSIFYTNKESVTSFVNNLASVAQAALENAQGTFEELRSDRGVKNAIYKMSVLEARKDIRPAAIVLAHFYDYLEIVNDGTGHLNPTLTYREIKTTTGSKQLTPEKILQAAREANAIVEPAK